MPSYAELSENGQMVSWDGEENTEVWEMDEQLFLVEFNRHNERPYISALPNPNLQRK